MFVFLLYSFCDKIQQHEKTLVSVFLISVLFLAGGVIASGTVDINTASLAQLDTLTGIGPKYAQAIINARPFSSLDDLLRVKGIGPKTLQKIKDQGLAFISGQAQQPAQPISQTPAPVPALAPNIDTTNPITAAAPIVYPAGVVINEIMPNPAGSDETDEWLEIYNSNAFDVDLSGWQIQDTAGTITTYTISQSTQIVANGYLVFKRPDTKIMLNNDQDGLNLLTPDKKVADSTAFTAAPLNESYNKTTSGWKWSSTPTPGNKNVITQNKTAKATNVLSKTKNSVTNDGVAIGLADISQNINTNQEFKKTTNPWFLFFIVLATTIILASIILFIKLKLGGAKQN